MIVKIPDQRQFPDGGIQQRFDDLVKYLLEKFGLAQAMEMLDGRYQITSNHETVMPGFTDILTYAAGDPSLADHSPADTSTTDTSPQDKCLAVEVHGVAHLSTAVAQMNAVAARNPRVKDAAYHFILSWPEHESPPHDQIFDAARHALRALNLQEHQYVIAIHGNTDNIHCHIAVNRVHPVTFKSQHLPYTWRTLHYAARESEIKHGWHHDNGLYLVEVDQEGVKHIVKNAKLDVRGKDGPFCPVLFPAHESSIGRFPTDPSITGRSTTDRSTTVSSPWTDPESLINWVRSTIAPRLKDTLPTFASWQDLHQFLAQYQMALKDTGGGGMRLTATDPETGEVLDIAASKALRILKRTDLETRWGAYQAASVTTESTKPRSNSHAKNFADFDQFDQFAPHPETTARRERVRKLRGEHVDGDERSPEVLLPRDAPDHMDHTEAEFDSCVRRGSDGRRGITPSPAGRSKTGTFPADPFQFDPSRAARSKRDPLLRAERKEARAAERIELRRRYQQYRATIAAYNTEHDTRKADLRAAQRLERQTQKETFHEAKRLHGRPAPTLSAAERQEHATIAALLAHNHALAKLALSNQHQIERTKLGLTRLPALQWRDWLLEEAQLGSQPALSALRGIVYQAQRDGKLAADPFPTDPSTTGASPAANSPAGTSPAANPTTAAYLAVVSQLQASEMRERAIRSGNASQVKPYQCDALLVQAESMTYRVTGNGNVQFYDRTEHHLFTDRGNRITFDRPLVTDDELRLALLHAREKFGNRLTLTGEDPIFTARMARMADDLGMEVLNPELLSTVADHRAAKLHPPVASLLPTPQPESTLPTTSSTTTAPEPVPAQPITPEPIPPKEIAPRPTTPPLDTPAPIPAQPTHPEPIAPLEIPPKQVPTQPVASPTPILPTETVIERLRQDILAEHPRATFVTVNKRQKAPYIGKVVAVASQAFAQRVGRNAFALHPHAPPANMPTDGKHAIHIQYHDGRPTFSPTPQKTRTRNGR